MAEACVTHGAAVRFLAGVDQHVSTQVSHLTDLGTSHGQKAGTL